MHDGMHSKSPRRDQAQNTPVNVEKRGLSEGEVSDFIPELNRELSRLKVIPRQIELGQDGDKWVLDVTVRSDLPRETLVEVFALEAIIDVPLRISVVDKFDSETESENK
jgi:hypothetical protein